MKYPNLKAEFARLGLTQSKVAEMMGVLPPFLNRKINGKVEFTMPEIKKILEITGCKFEYLFKEEL